MPLFCCVVNCSNRGGRDNVKFYRIPAELHFKHKIELNNLSRQRRHMWISALQRKDLTDTKLKYACVCSKHFITGKPAELQDTLNLDWVPSINMGYIDVPISSAAAKQTT